jgi:hypothetical protein
MNAGYKILAALVLAAACVAGYVWWHGAVFNEGDSAGYARAEAEYTHRENKALHDALDDKARLETELQHVSQNAREQAASAAADLSAASDAGGRLRDALAAARRRPAQCPISPAGGSAPADTTERVLADVQRRLDEATDRITGFADAAHIAGQACERAADAVK